MFNLNRHGRTAFPSKRLTAKQVIESITSTHTLAAAPPPTWVSVAVGSAQVEAFPQCLFSQPWLQWPCVSDRPPDADSLSDALMVDQNWRDNSLPTGPTKMWNKMKLYTAPAMEQLQEIRRWKRLCLRTSWVQRRNYAAREKRKIEKLTKYPHIEAYRWGRCLMQINQKIKRKT